MGQGFVIVCYAPGDLFHPHRETPIAPATAAPGLLPAFALVVQGHINLKKGYAVRILEQIGLWYGKKGASLVWYAD